MLGGDAADTIDRLNIAYQYNVTTDVQMLTGVGRVTNVTLLNLAATVAAKIILYDGAQASGDIVSAAGATAGGSSSVSQGWLGAPFRRGLFLHIVSGTVLVVVTYIPKINHW